MDLVSIPPCTSRYVCSISPYTYKVPCLWVDKLILILFDSFHYRFVGVTLNALSPHPFRSTFGGFAFISNLTQTLGCLIALLMNASWGSIIVTNNILYLTRHSFILGILSLVYCTFLGISSFVTSLMNISSPFTPNFCFHCVAWLPSLIIFVNFRLLFNLCLSPFYYLLLGKKFVTNLSPYNNGLFRFNSSQKKITNF